VTEQPGSVLDNFLGEISKSLASAVGNVLINGSASDRVEATARTAADIHDRAVAGLAPMVAPAPPPLACRRGCNYCCHVQIITDVPTVIRLAAYFRVRFSSQEVDELRRRINERLDRFEGLPEAERRGLRLPCPLLVDGACSAYEARPLICRSYNSFDADACEREIMSGRSDRQIPAYDVPLRVGIAVAKGMEDGLGSAGHADGSIELVRGLRIALDEPQAAELWLAGSDLFAPARFSS